MVEQAGLENRCTLTGTVGSNPTLSAKKQAVSGQRSVPTTQPRKGDWLLTTDYWLLTTGEVLEWSNRHDWKSCVSFLDTEGSNPSLSANLQSWQFSMMLVGQ